MEKSDDEDAHLLWTVKHARFEHELKKAVCDKLKELKAQYHHLHPETYDPSHAPETHGWKLVDICVEKKR